MSCLRLRPRLKSSATLAFALLGVTAVRADDVVKYVVLDGLGNIRVVTDEKGNILERHDYLAFGEECTTGVCANNPGIDADQPLRFTGKERDRETGLDYFGARYYGSKIGRFTTVDPVYNWNENLVDPQRWNRYAYARNNPFRYVDPDGRDPRTVAYRQLSVAFGKSLNNLWWLGINAPGDNPTPQYIAEHYMAPSSADERVMMEVLDLGITLALAAGAKAFEGEAAAPATAAIRGETRFTAAGRRAHAEEPLPPGFERDVGLPSGKRMDGYNAAERQVIEIKPNNPRATRRGERQVEGYCRECDQTLGPGHTGRVQTYEPKKYLNDKN